MQFITFDEDGNCVGSNFMDYLLPTAWETPGYELHEVVTPCPHHPIGAKGVGECATVGGPAAFVNAVMNAIKGTGVRNIDMPLLPDRVYEALTQRHDVSGAPPVADGRLDATERQYAGSTAGRSSSRPPSWRGRGEEFALATVVWRQAPVVRAAGLARDHHGRRPGARLDRRRLRRAGGHPRGPAGDPRREPALLLLGTPEQFGADLRAGAPRDDGRPDLVPERGRR